MVHHLVRKNNHGLTIIRIVLYGQKFIMCYDRSWIQWLFVTGAQFLNGSHGYIFSSSMGHPMSDSVELLVYDGTYTYITDEAFVLYYRSLETASTLLEIG
jgi:hypothetical protein